MMDEFALNADKIGWPMLRDQKRWLAARAGEGVDQAEGLLNFLDYVQDSAVGQEAATVFEVFGKRCCKCGRDIPRPYLSDDEDERCERCADS